MWQKTLIIIFLLFIFALLQNSFFIHFSLFEATPNLVFILFFLVVFFDKDPKSYLFIFWGIIAGLLLDVTSRAPLGLSVVLFIIIGVLLKKTQFSLKNKEATSPFFYFFPLFTIYFIVYEILLMVYLRFFDSLHTPIIFDTRFIAGIIYNLLLAISGFWIFKKIASYVEKI